MTMNIQDLLDDFEFLEDWEDRYRYVIELGRKLDPLPEEDRNAVNKVSGCASQVWLASTLMPARQESGLALLSFKGDSDAHIVRGLIAILFVVFSNKSPEEILAIDVKEIFSRIGLVEHLSPQRSNGLISMVGRIKRDAQNALTTAG